jgi:3-carboxy-cis,cis-muconate cycloisomerase
LTPFEAIFVPDELADAVSDRAWLEGMLDAERALANAEVLAGAIPAAAAAAVVDACRPELYDPACLAADGRAAGNPVEPLVRALREQVGGDAAQYVHWGATSQDILDSAAMLVARRALWLIGDELAAVADVCAALAREHRATPMAARTLLQQAVPTTFGLKAAGWLVAVLESRSRLRTLAAELPAQLGGAAGTLAALGDRGPDVLRLYAVELELREPVLPWHTNRQVVAELGAALALAAGAAGKIGGDIALLAQSEIAEVAERSPGVSSTMPNKRNPVGAVLAVACAARARGAASVLLASLVQEHERAAGAWHAEWHALSDALASTGGAAASLRRSLDGLEVDTARMRENIGAEALAEAERFGGAERPEDYLGSADALIDRALAFHGE